MQERRLTTEERTHDVMSAPRTWWRGVRRGKGTTPHLSPEDGEGGTSLGIAGGKHVLTGLTKKARGGV